MLKFLCLRLATADRVLWDDKLGRVSLSPQVTAQNGPPVVCCHHSRPCRGAPSPKRAPVVSESLTGCRGSPLTHAAQPTLHQALSEQIPRLLLHIAKPTSSPKQTLHINYKLTIRISSNISKRQMHHTYSLDCLILCYHISKINKCVNTRNNSWFLVL